MSLGRAVMGSMVAVWQTMGQVHVEVASVAQALLLLTQLTLVCSQHVDGVGVLASRQESHLRSRHVARVRGHGVRFGRHGP